MFYVYVLLQIEDYCGLWLSSCSCFSFLRDFFFFILLLLVLIGELYFGPSFRIDVCKFDKYVWDIWSFYVLLNRKNSLWRLKKLWYPSIIRENCLATFHPTVYGQNSKLTKKEVIATPLVTQRSRNGKGTKRLIRYALYFFVIKKSYVLYIFYEDYKKKNYLNFLD